MMKSHIVWFRVFDMEANQFMAVVSIGKDFSFSAKFMEDFSRLKVKMLRNY